MAYSVSSAVSPEHIAAYFVVDPRIGHGVSATFEIACLATL